MAQLSRPSSSQSHGVDRASAMRCCARRSNHRLYSVHEAASSSAAPPTGQSAIAGVARTSLCEMGDRQHLSLLVVLSDDAVPAGNWNAALSGICQQSYDAGALAWFVDYSRLYRTACPFPAAVRRSSATAANFPARRDSFRHRKNSNWRTCSRYSTSDPVRHWHRANLLSRSRW